MTRPLIAALILAMTVSGCGRVRESRINPFNWFGGSTAESIEAAPQQVKPSDPRALITQIAAMRVDRTPGGAIIHAIGVPPHQGYWETDLVRADVQAEPGVLVFDFRAWQPISRTATGTPFSREVTATRFLSDQDLQGVSRIVVRGTQNQHITNRR